MPLQYNEWGGMDGYQWTPLPQIAIGTVVYFRGRDVRVTGIQATEHVFTRTEPIVQVVDVATLQPDSFSCQSKTEMLLRKL